MGEFGRGRSFTCPKTHAIFHLKLGLQIRIRNKMSKLNSTRFGFQCGNDDLAPPEATP